MAWELRKGRPYYYRSERVAGVVVKRYVGGGALGLAVAERHAAARAESERDDQLALREEALTRDEEELSDMLTQACNQAVEKALLLAGFHKHNRAWRRNGGQQSTAN